MAGESTYTHQKRKKIIHKYGVRIILHDSFENSRAKKNVTTESVGALLNLRNRLSARFIIETKKEKKEKTKEHYSKSSPCVTCVFTVS